MLFLVQGFNIGLMMAAMRDNPNTDHVMAWRRSYSALKEEGPVAIAKEIAKIHQGRPVAKRDAHMEWGYDPAPVI
jgi:hypothetical protein